MHGTTRHRSGAIRSRFAARLFLLVAAAVVLPAAALFLGGLAAFEGAVRGSIDAELASALDRTERDLTSFLADLVAVSGAAATGDSLREALGSRLPEYELARKVDRSFDALLAALPGRESIRYTLIGPDRIFSSWSRNFEDYGFLRSLPLAEAALGAGGHLVWEGFSPSFVLGEGRGSLLVSVARRVEADSAAREGVLIIQAEREAFRRWFRERRSSGSFASVLLAGADIVADASTLPLAAETRATLSRLAAAAKTEAADQEARTGGYLVAARSLTGLPEALQDQDWSIAVLYDYRELDRRFSGLRALFLPSFAILLAFALVASWFGARRIVRPLADLSSRMEGWLPGDPLIEAPPGGDHAGRDDEIGALARAFGRLQAKVDELFGSLQREHEVKELFRYRALRAQLNPHFLLNSLSTIRWMAIIRKADNIVGAIDELSGLLSYVMGRGGDTSTLGEELESAERYLAIQNLRHGGRFSLERRVPEPLLGASLLRFTLQPLVENCVVHGYSGADREGIVELSAREEAGELVIEVADRGKGPGLDREPSPAASGDEAGLGLANVRDMLAIVHGPGASLELLPREGGGALVVARLPLRFPARGAARRGEAGS